MLVKYSEIKMNPFKKFIHVRINELGLSRKELATRLALSSIAKSYELADQLTRGENPLKFEKQIANALEISKYDLQKIWQEEISYLKTKEIAFQKANFKPYIFAIFESPKNTSFQAAVVGSTLKYCILGDEFLRLTHSQQLQNVKETIKMHYTINVGVNHYFGKILQYRLHKTYEDEVGECQLFDTNGDLNIRTEL